MSTTNNGNRNAPQPTAGRLNPRRVGLRRQAAPTIDIDIAADQVDDLQREIAEFPDLKRIMAYDGHPTGVDGHYGPRTFLAIANIAEEAHISMADIPRIDFRNKTGELYNKWHTALQNHHKKDETPQQVVQRVEQAPAGPSAAELAAAAAAAAEAARLAAEAAAREAANNRVPASIRGTQYDPRYLATLSTPDLINIAKDGLHGIGEISRGFLGMGSYHRNGRLGDVTSAKLLEHAHKAGIIPRDQDTLTRRELELTVASLGEATVRHTGFALAQLPPETNPMTLPVATTTTPTATATAAGLTDNARAQADSVRGGLSQFTDGQSRVVSGRRTRDDDDMPRPRHQRVRVEGGEQSEGPDAPQRFPAQELRDGRIPLTIR